MKLSALRFIETVTRRGERVGPLVFVAYGDEMEADARAAFKGTGIEVIRAKDLAP